MEILHNMIFKKREKERKQLNSGSSPVKNLRPFFINLTVLSQGTCLFIQEIR